MNNDAPLVLITRPKAASERFAEALRAVRTVKTLISPVIEIESHGDIVMTESFAAVVFTSSHAVSRTNGEPDQTAYCVGEATAAAAREVGYMAVSADGGSEDLVALILRNPPGGKLLHVRGAHTTGEVANRLNAEGLVTEEIIAYRQVDRPLSMADLSVLESASRIVAPVFSSRSAGRLAKELDGRKALTVVAISRAAAEGWTRKEDEIVVAEAPTADAMLRAVAAVVDSDSQCRA